MIKKKQPKLKRKPRIIKKSENRVRNGERVRLEGVVAGLSKTGDELRYKIRHQAGELKVKEWGIKEWGREADKVRRADSHPY